MRAVDSGVARSRDTLHPASVAARVVVAFVVFGLTATAFMAVLVVLLPSRRARLRAGSAYARWIGPIVLRIFAIRMAVDGRERIAASEPAIFVINHSSSIDTFACMGTWPDHGCCVGKKQVLWIPFFGLAYWLSGNLLIDRSNPAAAIATMNELATLTKRLRLSIWLSPEGTRSKDGQLGPFKKGFAHLALATGLPVVPVVLHGAATLWPNPGWRITPGTVRLAVGEPIDTTGWRRETLDEHVEGVRSVFVEALATA